MERKVSPTAEPLLDNVAEPSNPPSGGATEQDLSPYSPVRNFAHIDCTTSSSAQHDDKTEPEEPVAERAPQHNSSGYSALPVGEPGHAYAEFGAPVRKFAQRSSAGELHIRDKGLLSLAVSAALFALGLELGVVELVGKSASEPCRYGPCVLLVFVLLPNTHFLLLLNPFVCLFCLSYLSKPAYLPIHLSIYLSIYLPTHQSCILSSRLSLSCSSFCYG